MHDKISLSVLVVGLFAFSLAGCGAKPVESHHPLQAEVITLDLPRNLIVVQHGEIPGFMLAMTMGYSVAIPKEAETLQVGDKISADLVLFQLDRAK